MKETNKKVYQPNNNKVGQSTDDWRIQAAQLHRGYHSSFQPFSVTIASVCMFEDNGNDIRLWWWPFFLSCHYRQSPTRFRKRRHSNFFSFSTNLAEITICQAPTIIWPNFLHTSFRQHSTTMLGGWGRNNTRIHI